VLLHIYSMTQISNPDLPELTCTPTKICKLRNSEKTHKPPVMPTRFRPCSEKRGVQNSQAVVSHSSTRHMRILFIFLLVLHKDYSHGDFLLKFTESAILCVTCGNFENRRNVV
jgi:hypothetical protein